MLQSNAGVFGSPARANPAGAGAAQYLAHGQPSLGSTGLSYQQQQQQQQQYATGTHGVNASLPAPSVMMQQGPSQTSPYAAVQPGQSNAAPAFTGQRDFARQSASPQQGYPSNASLQSRQSPSAFPMAAPGFSQPPSQPQQAGAQGGVSTPQTPQSPSSSSGNHQQRVNLVLEINAALLQRLSDLQAQDQGGATSPAQAVAFKKEGRSYKPASEEFTQTLRYIQGNLTYLSPAKVPPGKVLPGPAYMTPPPQMPELQTMYDQLQELFPHWHGLAAARSAATASPQSNAPSSMNGAMLQQNQQ